MIGIKFLTGVGIGLQSFPGIPLHKTINNINFVIDTYCNLWDITHMINKERSISHDRYN
jgi:hypothetical protein